MKPDAPDTLAAAAVETDSDTHNGAAPTQRSLFGEILDWMLAPMLLLWPVSVLLTWLVAQGIANKPFDRELAEKVRVLSLQVSTHAGVGGEPTAGFAPPTGAAQLLRSAESDELYYQVLGLRGEFLSGDRELPVPPEDEAAAPAAPRFRNDTVHNHSVRVAYQWVQPGVAGSAGPALVQVAETVNQRSQLATEIIKGVILPQFVILPLAVLLVWLALARGIAPLHELQQRIRRRDSHDLSPIDELGAPEEVAPLVRAINDLLARLNRSMSAQRHFLADAAHQLKTPLAGLRTQAELAQREIDAGQSDPRVVRQSLQQIALSSQRAAHMVNQLLALARAEDNPQVVQREPVRLSRVAAETMRDFVPRAMDKHIDLGYEGPAAGEDDLVVDGQPVLIGEVLRNLVDNALLYTPGGGTVTVRVIEDPTASAVLLQVEDDGPGIALAEREAVFRPFYRALGTDVDGSGLGLAIVREIARHHGAVVSLEDAAPGARFTLRFAAHAAPPGAIDSSPLSFA